MPTMKGESPVRPGLTVLLGWYEPEIWVPGNRHARRSRQLLRTACRFRSIPSASLGPAAKPRKASRKQCQPSAGEIMLFDRSWYNRAGSSG
jgi:hypothetical protein